jgi:hypothetical protein
MKTEQDLLLLKSDIDKANTEVSVLSGQRQVFMGQFKEKWGFDSLITAEYMLEQMRNDIITIKETIDSKTKELEDKFNIK